jgi:hypothetical protein
MSAEELLISMGPILLAFAFFVIFGLLSSREKRRRIELNHRERMAAIEKGVPLPEMPELDNPNPWNRPRLQKSYPNAALTQELQINQEFDEELTSNSPPWLRRGGRDTKKISRSLLIWSGRGGSFYYRLFQDWNQPPRLRGVRMLRGIS